MPESEAVLPLVRHAPTKLNRGEGGIEKSRGWLRTPPDPDALADLAPQIADELEKLGVVRLIASDLPRAAKTAEAVGKILDIPVETTAKLRTWDVGDMAGRPEEKNLPLKKKLVKYPEETPPGGEPFADFQARWTRELYKWISWNEEHPGSIVALVVHGNMVMTARPILDGDDVNEDDWELDAPGSVTIVRIPDDGEPYVEDDSDDEDSA